MSTSSYTAKGKRCGNCKWLDAPSAARNKDGAVNRRHDYHMYPCGIPFIVPEFPARFRVEIYDKKYVAPAHGENCALYEPYAASGSNKP